MLKVGNTVLHKANGERMVVVVVWERDKSNTYKCRYQLKNGEFVTDEFKEEELEKYESLLRRDILKEIYGMILGNGSADREWILHELVKKMTINGSAYEKT